MPIIPIQNNQIDPVTGLTLTGNKSYVSPKLNLNVPTTLGRMDQNTYNVDVDKYKKYVPQGNVFVDEGLEDARAFGQSTGEKWAHGLVKFLGKTATATLGGTVGSVLGLPNLFIENKSVYDTAFQRALDQMNEKMDSVLPNYMTSIEKEENFLQSLNNANFWANDVLGGLSFTAGAVLSEIVWSAATAATFGAFAPAQAAATASLVARTARQLKNFSKGAQVASRLHTASTLGKIGAAANTMRQIYTGAGYEAGVEARHHKHEITEHLKNQWLQLNPGATEIPEDELARIHEKATNSANGVFAANLAIVGLGNMIALPRIFGPGLGTQAKAASRIMRTAEGTFEPTYKTASRLGKIAEKAYLTAKNPFVEGVWEEGMQSVTNNTMIDYTSKKYNPFGTDNTASLAESFGEGLAETYGSKEGWKEIGIGMIIGSIGSPNFRAYQRNDKSKKLERRQDQPLWTGGIAGEFQERSRRRSEADRLSTLMNKFGQKELIEFVKSNPEYLKSTRSMFEHTIRSAQLNSEMDQALEKGDVFGAKNIEHDIIHSYITSRIDGGFGSDLVDEFAKTVRDMDNDQFAETFDYNDLTESELSKRKSEVLENFEKKVSDIKKATSIVDGNFKADLTNPKNKDIREALIYAASTIDNVDYRENQIAKQIEDATGVVYDKEQRGENYKKEFEEEVNRELEKNPKNKPEISELLKDLGKLQKRRESFINQYRYLFTPQGQKEYADLQTEVMKDIIKSLDAEVKEQYKGTVVVEDTETGKKYKKYDKSDGTSVMMELDENDKPIGEEIQIEVNDDFISQHDVVKSVGGRTLTPEQSTRLIKKLRTFKDPDEITKFIKDEITPLNLANHDLVLKEARKMYQKLTGEKLDSKAPRYVDKVYKDKSSGKRVLIRKDNNKEDTYYVKEIKEKDTTKNIATVTKQELEDTFIFERTWKNYQNKAARMTNLEQMITSKEAILDKEKQEGKNYRKELKQLQQRHKELILKLKSKENDGRATKKTIAEVQALLDSTQSMIEELQAKVDASVSAQVKIKAEIKYLYDRIAEEENQETVVDLKEKVAAIEEDIKVNEEAIFSWKYLIEDLKKLMNKLLAIFEQGKLYTEKTPDLVVAEYESQIREELMDFMTKGSPSDVVEVDGKLVRTPNFEWYQRQRIANEQIKRRLAAKKAAITKAIERGIKVEGEYKASLERIEQAENQIRSFEKSTEDLFEKLFMIEEEVRSLRQYLKTQALTVGGYIPVSKKKKDKSDSETNPAEKKYQDKDEVPSDHTKNKEEEKSIWTGVKRNLRDVFRGLTGRHVEANRELTSDKDQRRYYRWTSKNDLSSGKYYIKVVPAFEQDREKIESAGYKFEDAYYALVTDKDGKYVAEDGSVSDTFNRDTNVWTSFPLETLDTKDFGDKYYVPQTFKQWQKMYPGVKTVEEAQAMFENEKKQLVKQHEILRERIKKQIENGQEVRFRITDKAVGVPNDPYEEGEVFLSASEALGHKDVEVIVNTDEVMTFRGKTFVNLKRGLTFIYDTLTGNIYEAIPRKLNDNEVNMVINMFRSFANKSVLERPGFINSKGAGQLTAKDGSVIGDIFKVMTDLVFWSGDNTNEDGSKINKNENNSFHFVKDFSIDGVKNVPGGAVKIGSQIYQLFVVGEDNKVMLNRAIADENGNGALKDFLIQKSINIRSKNLRSTDDYVEFTSVDENGVATFKVHKGEEGGYKSYLLGNETGTNVLGVSLIPAGVEQEVGRDQEGNPIVEEIPQVLNQYAIYSLEDDYVATETTQIKEEAPVPNFDGLPKMKTGERLRVIVTNKKTKAVESTGILEKNEEGKLVSVEGNLSVNAVININAVSARSEGVLELNELIKDTNKSVAIGKIQSVQESKPVETIKPEKPTRPVKKGANLDPYRTPTNDQRGVEKLEEAEAWFKERFPNVDFNVVRHLIDGKYHGQFKKAAVYIYENAEIGTTYHEAFHVVTHLFLTKRERNSLYSEYRQQVPDAKNLSDSKIEEALAEEFRDFMLAKETNDGSYDINKYKTPIKKNFFQRLYDYIKNFIFGKPDSIAEVFEKIESNKYRNATPSVRSNSEEVVLNRSFKTKDEAFTKAAMEGVNFFFFQKLFSNQNNMTTLFSKESNQETVKKLYDYAKDQIERRVGDLYEAMDESVDQAEKDYIENQIDGLNYLLDNWELSTEHDTPADKAKYSVIGLHKNFLSQYKIEFVNVEDSISEINTVADPDNQWSNESIKISSKFSASKSIKLLLGTLVELNEDGTVKMNEIGLPQNADFGFTFNLLANHLVGARSLGQMKSKILKLSEKKPHLNSLIRRLKLNAPVESLSREDMLQQLQFFQTFAKTANNFKFDITGKNGKFAVIDSNSNSVKNKILQNWKNNAAKRKIEYTTVNGVKTYTKEPFIEVGVINSIEKALSTLRMLGITFSDTKTLTENNVIKSDIIRKTESIRKQIISTKGQVPIFNDEMSTDTGGDLNYFIDYEADTSLDYIDRSHFNLDNNLVYDITLNNYITTIINDIDNNQTLDEFFKENPHLDPENNPYTANSLFLQKGGLFFNEQGKIKRRFQLEIHEGSKEEKSGISKEFDDLNQPDQLRVHINKGLQGSYPILRPADNSIERYINIDKPFFSDHDIVNNDHIRAFLGYLKDELNRGKDLLDSKVKWENLNEKAKQGVIISILSNNAQLKEEIEAFFNSEDSTIEEFFSNMETLELIESELRNYFSERTDKLINLLVKYGIIETIDGQSYYNNGLNIEGNPTEITSLALKTLVRNYIINDTTINIEQTKLFFGDPINYKNVEDQFKRHSGLVGTKKVSAVYPEINEWIEKNLVRTDRKGGLKKNDQPVIRTAVFSDVVVKSKYYNEYVKAIGENKASSYAKMDEGDGQGYITIDEWREMLFRAGDWSFGVGSLEDLYQYEIQKEKGIEKPIDPITKRVIDPNNLPVANPLKPQHFGPLAEDIVVMGFYKLSLFPLLPSVTKEFSQLEALRAKMKKEGVGIVAFKSANKVGTKLDGNGKVQELYNDQGEFAYTDKEFITQDTYYKYWGIQVDTGFKTKKKVVSGTQMAKQIINGVFENGKPKNEKLGELTREYLTLNAERITIGLSQLIDSLGITKEGNNYKVQDLKRLIARFKKEAIERELPDNIIDAIDNLNLGIGVDSLVNREKIENIMFAIADSMTTSQKRSGSSKVQVSNAIGKLTRTIVNRDTGQVWDSSDLKFYTNEDGKITQMEVYLPAYFKGKITDFRLLDLIGFRIPTQGLNSIDSIVVKGFLPDGAGDSIIVPSEIVAKAGSDFDIDKLNIYYPNLYYDKNGNPKYIEYKNEEQLNKDYKEYQDAFKINLIKRILGRDEFKGDLTDASKILRKELSDIFNKEDFIINDVIDHIENRLVDFESMIQEGTDKQKALYKDTKVTYENILDLLYKVSDEIENSTTGEFDSMTKLEFRKRAIENRISEIQKDIILHPDNFNQLITPISAKELADEAKLIRELQGRPKVDKAQMHNVVEREYLLDVAKRFIGGKKAVGITAIHSTFDILSKMSDVSVKPSFTMYSPAEKKRVTVTTEINLPHNINSRGEISLSKLTDAFDKGNIPEFLSQWINAAVDAAKDPFMFDLNAGPETLNTVLYLTMAGVPLKHLTRFMTQPIIVEFLENRNKWESQMMEGNVDPTTGKSKKKFGDAIVNLTKVKYVRAGKHPSNISLFSVEQLEANIKKGARGSMDAEFASQQLQILDDFLRYVETAKKLGEAIRGVDYDTNAAGKNTGELLYKTKNTERVKEDNVLTNYDQIINEGFISPYYDAVQELNELFKPFFLTLKDESVIRQFDKLFKILFHERNNLSKDDKLKILDKFKQSFITHLFLTRPFSINNKSFKKDDTAMTMNSQLERLFKGNNSIAHRLENMKKKYPDMEFLKYLEPVISEDQSSTHHVISRNKKMDVIESNRYTNEWRELFNKEEQFAVDLMMSTLIQYGIENSPFTFTNLIPFEVYGDMMNSILQRESQLSEQEKDGLYDDFYNQFFLNNYNDDNIVPRRGTNLAAFYPFAKDVKVKPEYKNKEKAEEARSRGVNIFDKPIVYNQKTNQLVEKSDVIKSYRDKKLLNSYTSNDISISDSDSALDMDRSELLEDYSQTTGQTLSSKKLQPKPTGSINVYWGQPESETSTKILSNLAPRKFNYESTDGVTRTYGSVEHAYQSNKNGRFDKATYDAYVAKGGYGVKIAPKLTEVGKRGNLQLMKDLVVESFVQNSSSEAAKKLLQYENFTHNTNEVIDQAFIEGLKLAQKELLNSQYYQTENKNSLFNVAKSFNIQTSGFFPAQISKELLRQELNKKGFKNITIATASSGNLYLKDSKGFIKLDRLQSEYSQLSTGSQESSDSQLNDKIKAWLRKAGITYQSVENITDRKGNPVSAIAKADMLHKIVQVVEGKADITTLPEEAAHFLVELLPEDSPLLRGMMNAVEGTDVYNEVVAEYNDLYNGDETMLKKEAVGKMIAKAIVRKEKVSRMNSFQRFWDAAWRWIKNRLGLLKSSDLDTEIAPYAEAADIILGNVESDLNVSSMKQDGSEYYQLEDSAQKEEQERDAKRIIENFNENKVTKDLTKGGYITLEGKKVFNRVTDSVKEFYKNKFKKNVEDKPYNITLALKGTILHKYLELIGDKIFNNEKVYWKEIEAEVIKQLTDQNDLANVDFLTKPSSFFKLTETQFGELISGMNAIKNQVLAKQKMIDPKGEVKFFPELLIYDQSEDLAGTIDLAVVYSNGTVGIYDYKGIDFNDTQKLPLYKEQAYELQISLYKKVLSRAYGVKNFGETRIIPIDMKMTKTGEGFYKVAMGAAGLNDTKRPYLEQIPVDREMTDDKQLNISLTKMLNLYDKLSKQLSSDWKNERLRNRVERLREAIRGIQLRGDIAFIFNEINSIYSDFNQRENLPKDSPHYMTLDFLSELRETVEVYRKFGINAMETAKKNPETSKETIINLERVAHILDAIEQRIDQKVIEQLNEGENFNVEGSAKAEGFTGRLFKQLSKFNRPAFKKLSKIVRQVSDTVRKEVNETVAVVTEKTEALQTWAKSKGLTLQKAYDLIINPKTGDLISQFSKSFYESREKAIADRNKKWFTTNTNVEEINGKLYYKGTAKDRFEKAKKDMFDFIDKNNQGDQLESFRQRRKEEWMLKYDITSKTEALFNNHNYFIKPENIPSNFSEEYNFMLRPENKPLLDYYNMYIDYNTKFAEMTGKEINKNFVAEIPKDLIDRVAQVGLNGLGEMKDSLARSLEVREFDLVRGSVDPATGKPIPSIPLLYTDRLTSRLTTSEKKRIRDEVSTEYQVGTKEYEFEVEKREKRLEYSKGTKSKSRDLSRSLILFADAAYTYAHLNETESAALALRDILKTQGQETEIVDASGKRVIDKFTKKAAKVMGVPLSEIEAMEAFINNYWYGQSVQSSDLNVKIGDKNYSLTKAYQLLMKFTSAAALGLKPILSVGNLLGITSNYYMTGAEGNYYNNKQMNKSHGMLARKDPLMIGAIKFFEPFVHNLTYEKANNLSVSKAVQVFTFENVFILYKKGDELIDKAILGSMLQNYGIDQDGTIKRIDKIKGEDKRSLLDRSSIVNDKFVVEGLTEAAYTHFRSIVQRAAVGIKGNMPSEDRNLVGTSIAGQALMHFRSWMPGLIEKRFKGLQYDDMFDDYDVGRFRVFFGEFSGKTLPSKLKAFGNMLGEMAMMNVYDKKGVNMEVTKKFYDRYLQENPDTTLTIEEFVDLRKAKLKGMARELQIYLGFALMVFLGRAALPDDEDEWQNKIAKNMAENAFRMTQRGLLELSFFFDPGSITTILSRPIPTLTIINNMVKMLYNTVDETRDILVGEDYKGAIFWKEDKQDKTPPLYYFSKVVPIATSFNDFFDIFDTWDKSRKY